MAVFKGIREVSDAQFETLASGGTVQGETYDQDKVYETPVYEMGLGDGLVVDEDNLKTVIPTCPSTTNGTFVLKATVSGGVVTYAWVAES